MMTHTSFTYLLLLLLMQITTSGFAQTFDWQGHRGARGLMPENSIPAFKKALDMGVTTLEMDVVISQDKQVVVSHEPFFSASICLDEQGNEIPKSREKQLNIYQYPYDTIRAFDCGLKGNKDFPQQQKLKTHKPLLREVIREVETYRQQQQLPPVAFNIEIKSSPEGDNVFHPAPEAFSDLVYQVIKDALPAERVIIQSFDFRALRYWHENHPEYRLAALVGNPKSVETNLSELGFTPQIYSPYYKLILNRTTVATIKAKGMQLIPWTVNEPDDMKKLKSWGVDGIITDYPDRIKGL